PRRRRRSAARRRGRAAIVRRQCGGAAPHRGGSRAMTWRPGGIAAARIAHAGVLLAIAAFCFLSYSPFAYGQFIKPNVVPDLNDFVVLLPWFFALTVLATVLTLLPVLRQRDARGRAAAIAYIVVAAAAAGWGLWRRPLVTIGNSHAGFIVGLAALALP